MSKEPLYDTRSLEEGIKRCQQNIKSLEQAISQERTTIANYRQMIEVLERKKQLEEGITIDANDLRQ